METKVFRLTSVVCLGLVSMAALADSESIVPTATTQDGKIIVNASNFAIAETHRTMSDYVEKVGLSAFDHYREFTPLDKQVIPRMNRDTLYSFAVVDLRNNPAVISIGDNGGRYQSVLIINEGHFSRAVLYDAGTHEYTEELNGSRYALILVRTGLNADDPADYADANAAQDALKITQKSNGKFELPDWDMESYERAKALLKEWSGSGLGNISYAYGADQSKVDPFSHLVNSACCWGGWDRTNASYELFSPSSFEKGDKYQVTMTDVPVGEFWSFTVYNDAGLIVENEFGIYNVNSKYAEKNADGSVTVTFGGDANDLNPLPTPDGKWDTYARYYKPTAAFFENNYKLPEFIKLR